MLARARQGDSEAFRTLVERHSRRAFQLAFRMTGNEQDAEDVVQESFIRAYRQLSRFEARAHFATWLHRIVANCSVDLDPVAACAARPREHGRHSRRLEQPDAEAPDPERLAASAHIERNVATAMSELTPLERAAFTLRHYEGRSIAEIGKTLGLGAERHETQRVPCCQETAGGARATAG